ncbi:hypothetical protein P9Z35_03735 [Bacillus cereus]|nr:hypothetical protein [Bacillus cereus]MEC2734714.1 hypothetical protein [Bacillus cereus]MEC2760920.1 hypothetical protein [Bacillus cereus]MEC2960158.1 hypothetical protein [Bacillus cereus]
MIDKRHAMCWRMFKNYTRGYAKEDMNKMVMEIEDMVEEQYIKEWIEEEHERKTALKNDFIQWLRELKTTKRDQYKTEEIVSRLESIVWEEIKIHDTPSGNREYNYDVQSLYPEVMKD